MSPRIGLFSFLKSRCLTDEEFSACLTQPQNHARLERHLSRCSDCHDRLSGLKELLALEDEELPETSPEEIDKTLESIARARERETKRAHRRSYFQTVGIPAALFLVVGFGTFAIKDLIDKKKAESFLAQGQLLLEQEYSAQSPGGLRLDLPFSSEASSRNARLKDQLTESEHLFYQALALEPEMRDAHLGLGYLYLQKGRFEKARQAFQVVLDREVDIQALIGRGVAFVEESATEGAANRDRYLQSALADFDEALQKNPDSMEALYNKIRTLHELGRITEATRTTGEYLARDGASLWAERLKILRTEVQEQKP